MDKNKLIKFNPNASYEKIKLDTKLFPELYSNYISYFSDLFGYMCSMLELPLEEVKSIPVDDFLGKYYEDIKYIVKFNEDIFKESEETNNFKLIVSSTVLKMILIKLSLNNEEITENIIIKYSKKVLEKENDVFKSIFDKQFYTTIKRFKVQYSEDLYNEMYDKVIFRVLPICLLNNKKFVTLISDNTKAYIISYKRSLHKK